MKANFDLALCFPLYLCACNNKEQAQPNYFRILSRAARGKHVAVSVPSGGAVSWHQRVDDLPK